MEKVGLLAEWVHSLPADVARLGSMTEHLRNMSERLLKCVELKTEGLDWVRDERVNELESEVSCPEVAEQTALL